ncbi:hypothetical protein DNTS_032717 [Danionella cerebrum]|uniref:C3H1-type domain-containing protein n=1 Tax=Danionella cerebrum TaxID=2873325 RepID=A0A553Q7S7_9TELE|nr:hypothetical protein DNTS_032717 [Danionella translucida]
MSSEIKSIPTLESYLDSFWSSSTGLSTSAAWVPAPASLHSPPVSSTVIMDSVQPAEEPSKLSSELQTQLDLFLKLGFSQKQVHAAFHKLGLSADTNKVLGELVQAAGEAGERQDGIASPLPASHGEGSSKVQISQTDTSQTFLTAQEEQLEKDDDLRCIVIDGSNVAMSHGNKEVFSCLGIQLAVNFFLERGHVDITVFVPSWRKEQPRPDVPITDQHILQELERSKLLVFTPSRRVAGKRLVCYDDRFIVKLAHESDGIIVSNDTYRDLQGERPEWKRFIEERLLMYSFVNDKFMPPDDPLGRHGPTLDNFLRKTPRVAKKQPCPYGKKCTFGMKCKFHHPERNKQSMRSVADELRDKAKHSPHKPQQASSQSPSLEDVLGQKLSLEACGPPKKCYVSENVIILNGASHPTQRKHPVKKERRHSSTAPDSFPNGSQECLDSGLGSYECHSHENPYNDPYCDKRKSKAQNKGGRNWYVPPQSQTCSCCSFPPQQHHSLPNPGYNQPRYHSYGSGPVYPHSNPPQYSFPHHRRPQPGYWSDHYGAYPSPSHHAMQPHRGHGHWSPPNPPNHSPQWSEREQVRKKLLAIFNARLVDRAMDMFPCLMDPQRLAAEILTLQSQDGAL